MSDITFCNGMIIKERGNCPEWVLAKVSFKVEDMIQTLQEHNNNGWINVDICIPQDVSKRPYAKIDKWQPNQDNPANQGYVTRQAQDQPQRSNTAPPPPPPAPFPADDNLPGLDSEAPF